MMKSIAFAAALAIIPASVHAQSTGPLIRDPAGGAIRDPALGYGPYGTYGTYGFYDERPLTRDPAGGTMIDDSPRFRTYVVEQAPPPYRYRQPVIVGTILPREGVVYRDVPTQYAAPGYRYTLVDDYVVIVAPRSRRVVQIID
ncbi:MAG TPA: DUF1236 domain-containing protein [Bosea sp. (in: a-proteobacteria)]